jgi:PAS domain S-box-containing protein
MKNNRLKIFRRSALHFLSGGLALAFITFICFHFQVNSTTVALLYLIVIVLTSIWANLATAALISIIAYMILDSFFTAPLFRLGMSEPLDFVAPVAYLTTAFVITRLMKNSRQSFKEIRDLKDQLRLTVDTIPGMVWSALPDGSADFLNRRWLEYTGLSREEGLDWEGKIAIHSDDRERFLDEWKKALTSGQPLEAEARLRRTDGEFRRLLIRAVPLRDETGKIVRWYGTNTDIEDQKRIEEELRRSQADLARIAAELNMGEMAAAIAHEINQPLSAIVNNAGACLRWLDGNPPDLNEARSSAKRIIRDGNRASDVIVRIRALLKKTDLAKEQVDINQTVQEVINLTRNEVAENGIKLRLELAADVPPVLGDRVQLQQVFFNLVMNSMEAMSWLSVQPRELVITSCKSDSDTVLVMVKDSGTGIREEDWNNIFEAFFTTKPQGMGMGLAISRSIVEQHGGQIRLLPADGSGAAFQIILPQMKEDPL